MTFEDKQTTILKMSTAYNSFTVINNVNVSEPLNIIVTSPQALSALKVRFDDDAEESVYVSFNGSINLQTYYATIGRNKTGTIFLTITTTQPWNGSLNATLAT